MKPSVWGLLRVSVVLALVVPTCANCPQGWTSQGFKCTRLFTEPVTWKEAEEHCQSFYNDAGEPGHLLSVADRKENALLGLRNLEEEQLDGVWVGLARQDEQSSTMVWSNGLPTDLFGLFDDELLDVSVEGDCTQAITDEEQSTLLSVDCDTKLHYVCELSTCPVGWTSYAGNCYKYFDERKSWSQAEGHCQGYQKDGFKGHLVSIATKEENRFLTEWQKRKEGNGYLEETWIGLYGISAGSQLSWTVRRDFDDKEILESCLEMHKMGEGFWSEAENCSKASAHVCKISPCPLGLVALEDQCLLYLGDSEVKIASTSQWPVEVQKEDQGKVDDQEDLQRSHRASRKRRGAFRFNPFARFKATTKTKAKTAPVVRSGFSFSNLWKKKTTGTQSQSGSSRSVGSSPARKTTSSFRSFFSGFRNKFKSSNNRALSSTNTRKRFPSVFGAAFKKRPAQISRSFSSFLKSFPKAAPAKTQSAPAQSAPAQPGPVQQSFRFGNRPVTRLQGSNVMNSQSLPSSSSSSSSASSSSSSSSPSEKFCFPTWKPYGDSCYYFFTQELSWEAAKSRCREFFFGNPVREQANLVSISSLEENNFLVESSSTSPFWIGMDGDKWLDGSEMSNYAVSKKQSGGGGLCSYEEEERWGYQSCSSTLRFICKMPKAAVARVVRKKRSLVG